jgi:hypothetical protein
MLRFDGKKRLGKPKAQETRRKINYAVITIKQFSWCLLLSGKFVRVFE